VYDSYEVLHQKMLSCRKPIFPILPSVTTACDEMDFFIKKGHVNFSDEAGLANALTKVIKTPFPSGDSINLWGIDVLKMRKTIDEIDVNGYIAPTQIQKLLNAAGITTVPEIVSGNWDDIAGFVQKEGYPLAAKCVGPIHKSDIGGVVLNIRSEKHLHMEFERLMSLEGSKAVLIQPMLTGTELFIGAKYEETFGHIVLCGLGGIFVEVLKDIASGLSPIEKEEALSMIRSLKGYKIIRGVRGQQGIDEDQFAEIIVRLSALLRFAPEIKEMDINPLLATNHGIIAVDARIRVEK
jgi:acetyltransferase